MSFAVGTSLRPWDLTIASPWNRRLSMGLGLFWLLSGTNTVTTQTVSGLQAFQTFSYTTTDDYYCSQLETFAVDDVAIPMLTDPDYLNSHANNFVLRRTMPSQSRVYIGNGVIGWYPTAAPLRR